MGCAVITGDTSAPVSAWATVAESSSAEVELQVGGRQAAVLWRLAGSDVHGAAALAVNVLGDIGQQCEVGERPDDGDGLMDVDTVEHAGKLGAVDLRAAHPERLHAGPLDEVENLLPALLADGVAEDRAEHADVFAHRFGRFAPDLGAAYRTDRRQRDIGTFGHDHSIGPRRWGRTARKLAEPRLERVIAPGSEQDRLRCSHLRCKESPSTN